MTGVIDAVDAVIHQARTLLGSGQPATPPPPAPPGPPPAPPHGWDGTAADNAQTTSDRLHRHRHQLGAAHTTATSAMSAGTDIATDAHRNLDTIETDWNTDKDTLGPYADTPEGQAALTRAGMQRITDTQALVYDTAGQYDDASRRVKDATAQLPHTEDHPTDTDPSDPDHRPDDTPAASTDPDDDDPLAGAAASAGLTPRSGLPPSQTLAAPAGMMPMSAMMPQGLPTGGMPMGAGGAMPGGSGLASLLQPLTQAISAATSNHDSSTHDTDHADTNSNPSTGSRVVDNAARALGLKYVWGGGGAGGPTGGGFDCSGLAQFAVAQATDGHVILPRSTYDQIHVGQTVDPRDARPGDLVFSNFSAPGVPEHVQVYAGDGRVIEAQQDGVPVKYSPAPTSAFVVKRVV
ncbi:C40 family peptidase [Candidatus Mycobacterium methanotrophicum]|uniref:C40 family peptidase n=1 Tax=Candidatus Mycobacterium methanotrophicum TaxID=2943498 RepID=A0ABY4QSL6_9MYCO|nr:C40 family peptidase [Candidatus Mycobacterium methanotrophicum]UQX13532.1 C40 family peptidase [Candidatus Mycobacterium methanotrophicum]